MKRWGYVIVLVALGAGACWQTENNPAFSHDGGVDGGPDGSVDMATGCTKDSECPAAAPACDIPTGKCGPCTSSTSCSGRGATLTCDTTTDALAGQCVGCVKESDCATAGQACVANACVTCTQNSDCENGICDASKCVAAVNIIYVNNVSCTSGTKDGTSDANAYCQVTDALSDITADRRYVKVAGNGNQHLYSEILWSGPTALTVNIVGPGKAASLAGNGAVFNDSGKSAAIVQPTADATFTFDGLELIGSNGGAKSGVSCGGSGGTVSLTVRDCYIHDSGAQGIVSSACALIVDRSLLQNNKGSLSVTDGGFDVENTVFIGGQTTAAVPISLNTTSVGIFSFNTVVQNTTSGSAVGGIDCGSSTPQTILASIVYGNTAQGATQFGPKCALTSTVVGAADTTPGGIQVNPVFKAGDTYHLLVGSNPSVVNQLTTGPAFDIDDIARPINAKWDIGADEAE